MNISPVLPMRELLWVAVSLVLVSGAALADPAPAEIHDSFDITRPKQRLPAPGFQLPELNGERVSLESYRGQVVLIHFWATFCIPCLKELPDLETLWRQYNRQGVVVLGIAADRGSQDVVQDFSSRAGVTFPVLLDPDGEVRNRYEVTALPMTYLVGRDGRISGRAFGTREWTGPQGREFIEALLDAALPE